METKDNNNGLTVSDFKFTKEGGIKIYFDQGDMSNDEFKNKLEQYRQSIIDEFVGYAKAPPKLFDGDWELIEE